MKKYLIILSLFISAISFGQTPNTTNDYIYARLGLYAGVRDTTGYHPTRAGAIVNMNGIFYGWNGFYWTAFSIGGGCDTCTVTLQFHTAGLGLIGGNYNGSTPQTWVLDTAFIKQFLINPIVGVDTTTILVDSIICVSHAALEGVSYLVCASPVGGDTLAAHANQIVTRTSGVLNYQTPLNGNQLVTVNPVVYYQYSGTYPTGVWTLQHRVVQATYTNYGGNLNIGTSNFKSVNIGVKGKTIATFGTDSLLAMKKFIGITSNNYAKWDSATGKLTYDVFRPLVAGTNITINGDTINATGGSGSGTVESVASADGSITVTNPTTTVDLSVVKSPQLTTGRTLAITGDLAWTSPSFNGTGNVTAAGTIQNNVVSNAKLRQSAGLSVIGNSTNSTANVSDITADSDNQVLRRSGTAIGFGSIDLSQSNAVGTSRLAYANITAPSAASKLFGRGATTGDWQEITLGTNLSMSGTTLNASGGGGSGIDSVTKAFTSDSVLYWKTGSSTLAFRVESFVNVKDIVNNYYGAAYYGDSIHDESAGVQLAMRIADTLQIPLYFPKPKYFVNIANALDGSCNCQLPIPVRAFSDTARHPYVIFGQTAFNQTPVGGGLVPSQTTRSRGGTIIKSTIVTGADSSGVFGTADNNGNTLFMRDLSIEVPNPAIIGGVIWKKAGNEYIENVAVYTDTSGETSTAPSKDVSGFETPDQGYTEEYSISHCFVQGFKNGIKYGEHADLNGNVIQVCLKGLNAKFGYHAAYGGRNLIQWCKYPLVWSNYLPVVFSEIDIEAMPTSVSGGKWYDSSTTVLDTNNVAQGNVNILFTIASSGNTLNNQYISLRGGGNAAGFKIMPIGGGWNYAGNGYIGNTSTVAYPLDVQIPTTGADVPVANFKQNVSGKNTDVQINSLPSQNPRLAFAVNSVIKGRFQINSSNSDALEFTNSDANSNTLRFSLQQGGISYFTNSMGIGTTTPSTIATQTGAGGTILNVKDGSVARIIAQGAGYGQLEAIDNSASSNTRRLQFQSHSGIGSILTPADDGNSIISTAMNITLSNGAIQMPHYGAGGATFDGSGNITSVSDRRAKHSIRPFMYGLDAIMGLKTSTFIYNQDSSNTRMNGFIAQDVQKVIPTAVHAGKDGMLSLETNAVLAALVNAVKEQQAEIESLKKEVKKLKKGK